MVKLRSFLLVLNQLLCDTGLLVRISPDDHPQHPLDVGDRVGCKATLLLTFSLESLDQSVESLD